MQHRTRRFAAGVAALAAALFGAGAAGAASDSCREWQAEHRSWKAETLRRYLCGAPQRELDEALFEMLQREAYLTSCDLSVEGGRTELVGWRLVGRAPDEYGGAVAESVLESGGFDLALRAMFAGPVAMRAPAEPAPLPWRRGRRAAR